MSICQHCQTEFACGMVEQIEGSCWCTHFPTIPMPRTNSGEIDSSASCLCPECLPKLIKAKMEGEIHGSADSVTIESL